MGKRNLNLELFVVVSWMNSWVSPFIIPDIICFGFFTLDTRMVKFFMKLGVKFHSFFLEKKGEIFVPFTLFEKWKWNENDWKSRSRSESEIKMTQDRDQEVKKILENRDSRRSLQLRRCQWPPVYFPLCMPFCLCNAEHLLRKRNQDNFVFIKIISCLGLSASAYIEGFKSPSQQQWAPQHLQLILH